MSFRDTTKTQDLGPDRLNRVQGTPILSASVEATGRAHDLCTGQTPRDATRARILAWLAEGVREVTWALCSLPPEQWVRSAGSGDWSALRHARCIALREAHQTLPTVRQALDEDVSETPVWSTRELEQAEAAWDATQAFESAEAIVRDLAEARFELLQRLEAAPDEKWDGLEWSLLNARQHELEHLAAIWKISLNSGRGPSTPVPGVPLHAADRLEESH